MNKIIHGDSLEVLKSFEDSSIDLLCCDPPYSIGFMGKSWDKTLPDIGIFKECFRVLKAGSFAFVMSAPRSDVCARMMIMLEDAGFRIDFTPIYHTYASGFPKASNIGKMVDKRNGTERKVVGKSNGAGKLMEERPWNQNPDYDKNLDITKGNSPLEGSYGGFQPKPAVEVVIVAMKPLSEKTFVDQALKNGKGITWLDDCRVPTDWKTQYPESWFKSGKSKSGEATYQGRLKTLTESTAGERLHQGGRFPANLLVSDDVLNDGRVQKSGKAVKHNSGGENFGGGKKPTADDLGYADSGSYSRYFSLDAWAKTLPFLIVPKASKREKNEGLDGMEDKELKLDHRNAPEAQIGRGRTPQRVIVKNAHPTVKPLTLMSYLITLGSRKGDTVLDPFLGSGTTALAAKQLGRQYIGIEREKEYVEIAKARLKEIQTALL